MMKAAVGLFIALFSTAALAGQVVHGPYKRIRLSLARVNAVAMALHDRLPAVGHAQISDFTAGEEIKNPGSVAFCGAVAVSGDNGPNALKTKFFGRLQGTKPQFLVMDGPNSHVASVNCFVFSISLKN